MCARVEKEFGLFVLLSAVQQEVGRHSRSRLPAGTWLVVVGWDKRKRSIDA